MQTMARVARVLGLLAVVVPAAVAQAHHGSASFDTSKDLTLEGTVTEWIWANPHCFLKFDAKDDTGTVRNWATETQNPTDMSKRGWSRGAFKVGDKVTVVLQAVKNGSPVGRIRKVTLADGSTLEGLIGAPPPGAAAP